MKICFYIALLFTSTKTAQALYEHCACSSTTNLAGTGYSNDCTFIQIPTYSAPVTNYPILKVDSKPGSSRLFISASLHTSLHIDNLII